MLWTLFRARLVSFLWDGSLEVRILIAKHKTHIQNQMRLKEIFMFSNIGIVMTCELWLMTNDEFSSVFCFFFKPINSFDRHTKLDSLNVLTPSEIDKTTVYSSKSNLT